MNPSQSSPPFPEVPPDAPVSVLVVDDNRDSAESLALLLSMGGYVVRVAYDGREGLEAASELRPTVMLLDIGLPQLSGYEVARELGRRGDRPPLLIAMTAFCSETDRREAQRAGFHHHLPKPVDLATLQQLLRSVTPPAATSGSDTDMQQPGASPLLAH
ncbi:response regulator [Aquabacterium sp. A7-Y]|uniref:response regulator n=1 Tax=Aquabacterium sp. A7-Y TaxID=1349605 RepID=UPI00223DAF4B|nr:response regulator [Aquabacterium sp. A7-Y]MCW7540606.1 response regulator [Aquabacterium sp. A7-Y]